MWVQAVVLLGGTPRLSLRMFQAMRGASWFSSLNPALAPNIAYAIVCKGFMAMVSSLCAPRLNVTTWLSHRSGNTQILLLSLSAKESPEAATRSPACTISAAAVISGAR